MTQMITPMSQTKKTTNGLSGSFYSFGPYPPPPKKKKQKQKQKQNKKKKPHQKLLDLPLLITSYL